MKKNYTIRIPRKTFWTIILPMSMILLIIGGIIGIIIVDRFVMPNVTGVSNRGIVKIPDIRRMSWEDSRQKLYDIGLRLQVQAREYNDTLPNEFIISQRPEPQEKVKKGRHVFVIVSKGRETGTIPEIRTMTERVGKKTLREAGFTNVKVFRSYNEKYEKDLIALCSPPNGTVTSREIPVEITISKGPKPTHAVVPNVVGEILSEATALIEESGLLVGTVDYRVNPAIQPGSVVSQSVSPGAKTPLETHINLIVSASK